jgi:hypothetical protein
LSYLDASNVIQSGGLYLSSPDSLSPKISFPGFITNTSSLPVHISGMAAGDTLKFQIQAVAGCRVNIDTLHFLSNTFANFTDKNGTVTIPANFTIKSPGNGSLTAPLTQDVNISQPAAKGQLVTRNYVYTINGSFTGYIRFHDNLGPALKDSIISVLDNSGAPLATFTDTSSILLHVTAQQHHITIQETVYVDTCITSTQDGESTVTISTGCLDFESCNTNTYNPEVSPAGGPAVSPILPEPSFDSYFQCFGDTSYTSRQVSFTNNGSYARDVNVTFVPATGYITDPSSFTISITGGTKTRGGNFYRNPSDTISITDPLVVGAAVYGPYNGNSGTLSFYKDLIGPSARYSCNDSNYLWSRVINHFIDSSGQSQIDLDSGETLTISWKDKSCCLDQNTVITGFAQPFLQFFSPDCQNKIILLSGYNDGRSNQGIQKLESFNPMMQGNIDKCLSTNDGEIQDFTIQNIGFNPPAWIKNSPAT